MLDHLKFLIKQSIVSSLAFAMLLVDAPSSAAVESKCDLQTFYSNYTQALEAYISKDFTESIKLYKALLPCPVTDTQKSTIHLGLGRNYHELSLKENSLQEYSIALQMNPLLHQAQTNRGLVLASLGRLEEAIIDFNKAIKYSRNNYITLTNRGVAFATLGKFSNAIKDFDSAIKINPGYGEAYLNRGIIFELSGDISRACSDWKKALSLRQFATKTWIDHQCNQ
jgi:tetratricopeptide (TPR) repeat protein